MRRYKYDDMRLIDMYTQLEPLSPRPCMKMTARFGAAICGYHTRTEVLSTYYNQIQDRKIDSGSNRLMSQTMIVKITVETVQLVPLLLHILAHSIFERMCDYC